MKLLQVEIANFRCFKRLIVPLEKDMTAFIGINAAGKTAILDAIAMILELLLHKTIYEWPRSDGTRWNLQQNPEGILIKPTDLYIGAESDPGLQHRQVVIKATAVDEAAKTHREPPRIKWQRSHGFNDDSDVDYGAVTWLNPSNLGARKRSLYTPGTATLGGSHGMRVQTPVIAYYRAHRRFSAMPMLVDIFGKRLDQDAAFEGALDAGANYEAMCRWFYMRENQELRERDRRRNDPDFTFPELQAIRKVVSHMLDGVVRVYFDDDPPRLKVDQKDAQGQTHAFEVEQLSDGQRNLLALTLDFARRLAVANPNPDERLQAPGILLIDEIELHLHPKWQQTVVGHLREAFPNTQIIVATHSPTVLTTLEARQIRIVREQGVFSAPVETFGSDAGHAQRTVMDMDTRPPENPVTDRIKKLFGYLNADNLAEAETVLVDLENEGRADDPTLVEARTRIDNRKWEKELGL